MSIQALRERLSALNKECKNQLANMGSATWSVEDKAAFDTKMDEAERLQQQIEATQRVMDQDAEKDFKDVARNEPGGRKTELQQGLELFMRKSDRQLTQEEALMVRNTMSTTTGSEGGYTVQPLVATSLIDLIKAYGFMRMVASQITTANGADLAYPTSDGTAETGELIAQNTTATDADATFGTRALNAYKFSSKIITVPIELLQDSSIDVVAMIQKRMRARIGRSQNSYYSIGTGISQPMGLYAAASVGKVGTAGQVATVIYDDLVDLVDSLDAGYLLGAPPSEGKPGVQPGWQFSQAMRKVVRKIKDTTGRPIWTPSYDEGAAAKTPDLLLGYPVNINNDAPAPAASAKSIAFGGLDAYLVRDAMEVTMFRFDDSAYMKKGQVGFLAWARAGGNLMDTGAVKLYQHPAA